MMIVVDYAISNQAQTSALASHVFTFIHFYVKYRHVVQVLFVIVIAMLTLRVLRFLSVLVFREGDERYARWHLHRRCRKRGRHRNRFFQFPL